MNTDNFCHWLDGFLTLSKKESLNKQDVNLIKEHLNLTLRPETFNDNASGKFLNNSESVITREILTKLKTVDEALEISVNRLKQNFPLKEKNTEQKHSEVSGGISGLC